MDRAISISNDSKNVEGGGRQYTFLNGFTEKARNNLIGLIESDQIEEAEKLMEYTTFENQDAFKQWKTAQLDVRYPFLSGLNEDARKMVLSDIQNQDMEAVDAVMEATPNWSQYNSWKKDQEEQRFLKMYPFLVGIDENARKKIVTHIETNKLEYAEKLIKCFRKENLQAFESWKQQKQTINTPPEHQPNDQYPFLNGENDPVKETMIGHINNGRWHKADEFSVILSPNNQEIYQQWKLTKKQEDDVPYPFLKGAPSHVQSAIKTAIEAKDMALADNLSSALYPDMQAKYSEWKMKQHIEKPEVSNAKKDVELPFLVDENPTLKQLVTAEWAKGEIGQSLINLLKPENQKRFDEWKSLQQPSKQANSQSKKPKTIRHVKYNFLIGADEKTSEDIVAAIETNDLELARHLGDLLSAEKKSELQNWLNERALGLLFLDGESENLKAAMHKKMENNKDLDGMTALSKYLSAENKNLFRAWHDNERSGLSFLNGILDAKVMSNMRGFCVNRQFVDAESLLELIPAANRDGYYAWKSSLEENASTKASFGIVDENKHTNNSARSTTIAATSRLPTSAEETKSVPEAGDPGDFFQQNLPDHTNILILGETGVGKSTFINSLVNYVAHQSLEDAEQNGLSILIPVSFAMAFGNDYRESTRISLDPTIGDANRLRKNENVEQGQSSTQGAKEYEFSFTKGNTTKTLHIIDTPGIGDVRGIEQDKVNFENILNFIANYKELHAICILIKPNNAKLNVVFRFCIDQLLMRLHKTAADSIVFCFTSTRGTHYRPGDTYATLQTHLQNLHKKNKTQIDLNANTLYSFDNEGFRYLCARKQGHSFDPEETAAYKISYAHSLKEVKRLVANIALRKTHKVVDTICVNSTRHLLLTLMKPIGEISQQQMNDLREIDEKKAEIEQLAKTGADLTGQLNFNTVELRAVELTKPQTVCTSEKCVEYHQIDERSSQKETIYKTVCHVDCHLTGVAQEICPNADLKNCWAMGPSGQVCRSCACSWSTHMHIRYRIEKTSKTVVDTNVQKSIEMNESREKTAQIFINNLETKRAEIGEELAYMRHCCVEFASFLKRSSILSYNDSYGEYVKYLIRTEDQKVQNGTDRALLDQLLEHQRQYKEEVDLLGKEENSSGEIKNIEDLRDMVEKLHTLKHSGAQLSQLHEMERKTAAKSIQSQGSNVNVNKP